MIKIPIDPINPGHIFAAVGLIELASRLTGEAKGHFDPLCFHLSLREDWNIAKLINEIQRLELNSTDSTNKDAPLYLGKLRLDWWFRPSANDSSAGNLKTWAGNMKIGSILESTKSNLHDSENLLFDRPTKNLTGKNKPPALTSLDAQRSKSTIDIGYSPDKLDFTSVPAPSVEFLAVVGLQRAWPVKINGSYSYFLWRDPLPADLTPMAIVGHLGTSTGYTFQIAKDGKCSRVLPAQPINLNK